MILETKRLKVREFEEGDLDELAPILADPKVMEYSLSGPLKREGAKEYLDKILGNYEKHGFGFWAIVSKETNKMVGLVGPLKQEIDGEECVEIGYRITSSEWGKGYASEVVEAVKNYLFLHLNLDRLIAIIEPTNVRSVRVAEKVGFRLAKKTTFHGFNVGIYEIPRVSVVPWSEKWKEQFEGLAEKMAEGNIVKDEGIARMKALQNEIEDTFKDASEVVDQFKSEGVKRGFANWAEKNLKRVSDEIWMHAPEKAAPSKEEAAPVAPVGKLEVPNPNCSQEEGDAFVNALYDKLEFIQSDRVRESDAKPVADELIDLVKNAGSTRDEIASHLNVVKEGLVDLGYEV